MRYPTGSGPSWASHTQHAGTVPFRLIMRNDGNLVLYASDDSELWSTGTSDGSDFAEDLSLSAGTCGGECIDCAPGFFKDTEGEEPCTDCGAGKYSAASGATAESTCSACTANSDAPAGSDAASDCICNAGFTSDGAGGCALSDPTGDSMHTCAMRV